jgi:hypothetical protein
MIKLIPLSIIALAVFGCSSGDAGVVNVPNPDRVERKPYESMTAEEKIEFINKTPMPQDAKDREIANIRAKG